MILNNPYDMSFYNYGRGVNTCLHLVRPVQ